MTTTTPEYVVVGHCALDRQDDGSFLPGGTALYAALTASQLGMRAGVLTAGVPDALAVALKPYRDAFDLVIVPAEATTTFENIATPAGRKQTLHAWAGVIPPEALPVAWHNAAVLHLGPIADELPPAEWANTLDYFAWPVTTPQGWLRRWNTLPAPVRHVPLALPDTLRTRLRAAVISSEEEEVAGTFVRGVARHGLGVITHGARGAELLTRDARRDIPAFPTTARDETGAGDVFAAALFVGLARGAMPVEAARMACAAAALSIAGPGPSAIPSTGAIQQLMASSL